MRKWLKLERERQGITMADMAQKLDISESYYCLIECGKRQKKMDVTLMDRLSRSLGLSLAVVAEFETNRKET